MLLPLVVTPQPLPVLLLLERVPLLVPPPVPLEQLEGALAAQSRTLAEELGTLRRVLKRHG